MIVFNCVCDVRGCRYCQAVYFESDDDTFGQAKEMLRSEGWFIEDKGDNSSKIVAICKHHDPTHCLDLNPSNCCGEGGENA